MRKHNTSLEFRHFGPKTYANAWTMHLSRRTASVLKGAIKYLCQMCYYWCSVFKHADNNIAKTFFRTVALPWKVIHTIQDADFKLYADNGNAEKELNTIQVPSEHNAIKFILIRYMLTLKINHRNRIKYKNNQGWILLQQNAKSINIHPVYNIYQKMSMWLKQKCSHGQLL